jgi:glucokinase
VPAVAEHVATSAVLAVDIGATKMATAIVDDGGQLIGRAQAPTDAGLGSEGLFAALLTTIERTRAEAAQVAAPAMPHACGVGSAGPIDSGRGTVSPLNAPAWRDFPLPRRLSEAIGLPTFLDLDAKALARAEGWIGAAAGVADFVALVVSTGVGGGIVSGGRLVDGAAGNAGHLGHLIVEPDGAPCACGARGCLEAEASGPAIATRTGRPAEQADAATITRTGRLVGRAVAGVANLLDLRLAVVAGSVALGFGRPFFAAAQEELDRSCRLEFSRGCRIVPAGLGDRGPLVGAAAVAFAGLSTDSDGEPGERNRDA